MNGLNNVYMIINLFEIIIMLFIKYMLGTSTRRINRKYKVGKPQIL
jgi:5-methylcytosine-specific restriction endonuclease McrBC regulatory subunit McrC